MCDGIAGIGIAAVIALIAGGLVVAEAIGGRDPSGTVIAGGYAWAPVVELAAEESLEVPMRVDPRTLPDGDEDGVFAIFFDSALTDSLPHNDLWSEKDQTVAIRPWEDAELRVSSGLPELLRTTSVPYFDPVAEELEDADDWIRASWMSYETYYVVQYYDRDGELRDTPLVHTVRSSDHEMFFDTIVPTFSMVGTGGSVKATWNAPEGADDSTEYFLIKSDIGYGGHTGPSVVASTTETSWTSKPPTHGEAPERTFSLFSGFSVDETGGSLFTYEEPEPLAHMAVVAVGAASTRGSAISTRTP